MQLFSIEIKDSQINQWISRTQCLMLNAEYGDVTIVTSPSALIITTLTVLGISAHHQTPDSRTDEYRTGLMTWSLREYIFLSVGGN